MYVDLLLQLQGSLTVNFFRTLDSALRSASHLAPLCSTKTLPNDVMPSVMFKACGQMASAIPQRHTPEVQLFTDGKSHCI